MQCEFLNFIQVLIKTRLLPAIDLIALTDIDTMTIIKCLIKKK